MGVERLGESWFGRLRRKFAQGLVMGVLVSGVTAILAAGGVEVTQHLEYRGKDGVQYGFVMSRPAVAVGTSPFAIAAVSPETEEEWRRRHNGNLIEGLAETIRTLREGGATAILVDFEVPDNASPASVATLRKVLEEPGPPVTMLLPVARHENAQGAALRALPTPLEELWQQGRIFLAVSALTPDQDGVLRRFVSQHCVALRNGERRLVPALGATAAPEARETGCPRRAPRSVNVLFRVTETDNAVLAATGVPVVSAGDLYALRSVATQATVLVGAVGASAIRDQHLTAVGWMAGALVHANAFLTLQDSTWLSGSGSVLESVVKWLVKLGAIVIVALLAALGLDTLGRLERLFGGGPSPGLWSATTLACAALFLCVVVFFAVGTAWLWVALAVLPFGYTVGTLVPAYAAGLELMVKTGDRLRVFVEVLTDRLLALPDRWRRGRGTGPAILVIAALFATPAYANEGWQYRVEGGTITVQRGGRVLPSLPTTLLANDVIGPIPEGLRLVLLSPLLPTRERIIAGPYGSLLIEPPPTRPVPATLTNALSAFTSAVLVRSATVPPRPGSVTLHRGVGEGPLRALASLSVPVSALVAGERGLMLAWAGGSPPFVLVLEGQRSRSLLAEERTLSREAWLPNFAVPDEDIRVTLRDSTGFALFGRFEVRRGRPPTPPPDASQVEASLALFVAEDGAWRYAALGRLRRLADQDERARFYLQAIQNEGPPP